MNSGKSIPAHVRVLHRLLNKKFPTPIRSPANTGTFFAHAHGLRFHIPHRSINTRLPQAHRTGRASSINGFIQNKRKMVIFSHWTTITFLIARHNSEVGIPFVELTGKIPVNKRQALIVEFTNYPHCRVFLSTVAGGTGLNLRAADCVVNFELPWNPAKLNQRFGRVSSDRPEESMYQCGQISLCKGTVEEKIFAGIQLKTDTSSQAYFKVAKISLNSPRIKRTGCSISFGR